VKYLGWAQVKGGYKDEAISFASDGFSCRSLVSAGRHIVDNADATSSSTNKRLLDEVASVPSKRLRNKISGCECLSSYSDLCVAAQGLSLAGNLDMPVELTLKPSQSLRIL